MESYSALPLEENLQAVLHSLDTHKASLSHSHTTYDLFEC